MQYNYKEENTHFFRSLPINTNFNYLSSKAAENEIFTFNQNSKRLKIRIFTQKNHTSIHITSA